MSTTVIQSARIAVESTYGSLDATGSPSTSGLTFYGVRYDRGSFTTIGGAQEIITSAVAQVGPFNDAPEPVAPWKNGARVDRQTGDITLNMEVRGFGGGDGVLPNANRLPLVVMLGSSMHIVDTGGARLTPVGAGANAGEVTFATGTGPAVGEVVLADVDGCVVANRVSGVTTASPNDTVTFSHYWPRDLTSADRVQRGMNAMIRQGLAFGTVGPSFVLEMTCIDQQAIAYGCRLRSATFTAPQGKLMVALVIKAGIIVPDVISAGNVAPATAAPLLSPACILRRAALRTGDQSGESVATATAPVSFEAGEDAYQVNTFNLALSFTLTDIGTGCGDIGAVDCEVSGAAATFSYTSNLATSTHQGDLLGQVSRGVGVAAAPIQNTVGGSANYLNGFGAFIPSAHLTSAVDVQIGGEVTSQVLNWEAGNYRGDLVGGAAGAANQLCLFIGGT